MVVKTQRYKPLGITADTNRGPSDIIWGDCPMVVGQEDKSLGMLFSDDFTMAGNLTPLNAISNFGQWAAWGDTGVVLGVDPNQEGGVLKISPPTTTLAATLASNAGSFRLVSPASGFPLQRGRLWFECRVAVSSITTAKRDYFIGLIDNTTSFATATAAGVIAGANALATIGNVIGFHFRSTTNPTDVGFAFNVAGGTVQYPTGLQTLSLTGTGAALAAFAAGATGLPATGFIKLGFVYNPFVPAQLIGTASSGQTAGTLFVPLIRVFANGMPLPAFLTSTNLQAATFPTGYMGPTVAYTSRASSESGYIDWIQVYQEGVL